MKNNLTISLIENKSTIFLLIRGIYFLIGLDVGTVGIGLRGWEAKD